MSKVTETIERLQRDLARLEAEDQDLHTQVIRAIAEGDDERLDRLGRLRAQVRERLGLLREALGWVQTEAAQEQALREAEAALERERLARSFDAQNREVAETFAGLLLLALEAFGHWQGLRAQATVEAGRPPAPHDLRPRTEWRKVLEGILKTLCPLLADLSPAIPGDRLREHRWRAETLEALSEDLAGPLRDLAVAAARREREAADRRPAPDRKGLAQALSGRDRSGVSPLPTPALEVPRRRTGGS